MSINAFFKRKPRDGRNMLDTAAAQPQTPQLGVAEERRAAASYTAAPGRSCGLSCRRAACLVQCFSMAAHLGMRLMHEL